MSRGSTPSHTFDSDLEWDARTDQREPEPQYDQLGGTFSGGAGHDYIVGSEFGDLIIGNGTPNPFILDSDTLIGGDGWDTILGMAGDDFIYGGPGDDLIYGGDGHDYIEGNEGNNTVYGGSGHDVILLQDGNDLVYGEAGDDTIDSGGGNDIVFGGTGWDSINGGAGDDIISGGDGFDFLWGGAGADHFIAASDGMWDWIDDYSFAQGDSVEGNSFLTLNGSNGTFTIVYDGNGNSLFRLDSYDASVDGIALVPV